MIYIIMYYMQCKMYVQKVQRKINVNVYDICNCSTAQQSRNINIAPSGLETEQERSRNNGRGRHGMMKRRRMK